MRGSYSEAWEDEFIRVLAVTGQVVQAARAAGTSPSAAYDRRRMKPAFAQRWEAALRAPHLPERLRATLELMAQGLTNPEIAQRLHLTLSGTQVRVRAVLRELDAHTRMEAVQRARALGMLGADPDPRRRFTLRLCPLHGVLPLQWTRGESCAQCAREGRFQAIATVDAVEVVA